jgi:hypothetical protein
MLVPTNRTDIWMSSPHPVEIENESAFAPDIVKPVLPSQYLMPPVISVVSWATSEDRVRNMLRNAADKASPSLSRTQSWTSITGCLAPTPYDH